MCRARDPDHCTKPKVLEVARPALTINRMLLSTSITLCVGSACAGWLYWQVRREQRREELTKWLQDHDNWPLPNCGKEPIGSRVARFLLRKPANQMNALAMIRNVADVAIFREATQIFPTNSMGLCIPAKQLDSALVDTLERCQPITIFSTADAIELDAASLQRLSQIRCEMMMLTVDRLDDATLANLVQNKIGVHKFFLTGKEREWDAVTDDGLRTAAKLPLTDVTAGRLSTDSGVSAFREHPAAGSIRLIGNGYSDATVEDLATIPNLFGLELVDSSLSSRAIAEIVRRCGIADLTLVRTPLDDAVVESLRAKSTFRSLRLEEIPLDANLVSAIAQLPVKFFGLKGDYTDDLLERFAPLAEHLGHVTLRLPIATDRGLSWLKEATSIHWLSMRDTSISGSLIPRFQWSRPTTHLNLGGAPFNASMLSQIDRRVEVFHLVLEGQHITDETIADIQFPCSWLSLRDTRFTPAGLVNLERINRTREGTKIDVVSIEVPKGTTPSITPEEMEAIKRETEGRLKVEIEWVG
jgi:hypothetical protein